MVRLAPKAESSGFESVWVAETRITRDAVVPMVAIAGATERVRVGSAIMNVFTRGPVVIAITFVSLEEVAPGRIVMGLGTGSPLVLAPQGEPFERPLTRLREYCRGAAPADARRGGHLPGETIRLEGARIEDLLSQEIGSPREDDGDPALPRRHGRAGAGAGGRGRRRRPAQRLPVDRRTSTRARGLIEQGALRAGRDSRPSRSE